MESYVYTFACDILTIGQRWRHVAITPPRTNGLNVLKVASFFLGASAFLASQGPCQSLSVLSLRHLRSPCDSYPTRTKLALVSPSNRYVTRCNKDPMSLKARCSHLYDRGAGSAVLLFWDSGNFPLKSHCDHLTCKDLICVLLSYYGTLCY